MARHRNTHFDHGFHRKPRMGISEHPTCTHITIQLKRKTFLTCECVALIMLGFFTKLFGGHGQYICVSVAHLGAWIGSASSQMTVITPSLDISIINLGFIALGVIVITVVRARFDVCGSGWGCAWCVCVFLSVFH